VAWDAIVAIVHPDNPVQNISLNDLKNIYEEKITNWKELGGPDKRIVLISREEDKYSGVGFMFRYLVFGDPEYELKARSLSFSSSETLEEKIETSPAGMGITGISSAKKRKIKVLSLNGIEPSKENIASGKYPLWRPLYITIPKNPPEKIKKVVDFMLSPEGQSIISAQGTVNLEEGKALKPLWEPHIQKIRVK
jgi:phosphate transport system substrate-binding protein